MTSAAQVTSCRGMRQRRVQKPGVRAIGILSAECIADPSRHIGLVNL